MELSGSRKLLRIIICVLLAFSVSAAIWSFSLSSTVASEAYFQKHAVTGAMVSECEKQLTAKFAVLEAESGIPASVFETVKNEYPVSASLNTAFQNNFRNDDSTLNIKELTEHFELLCTDYLDGNKITYDKKYVRNTAREAAEIYSETVGVHNIKTAHDFMAAHKKSLSVYFGAATITAFAAIIMLLILYADKKRARFYILSAFTAGFAGTAFSGLLCRLVSPVRSFSVKPAIYGTAFDAMFDRCFMLVAAAGILLTGITWMSLYMSRRQLNKKSK